MNRIGRKKALKLLRQVIKGREDFIYPVNNTPRELNTGSHVPPCNYVRNGQPSCVVGQVLFEADIFTIDELANFDDPKWLKKHDTSSAAVTSLFELGLLPQLTRNAAQLLGKAQIYQDQGETWGKAVDRADRFTR